jgi:hypothetical protein
MSFVWIEMTFSQVRINCTIFVDGKIPSSGSIKDGQLVNNSTIIPFTYIVGEIHLDSLDVETLKKLEDDSEINMKFSYFDREEKTHNYNGEILKRWLFYEYLVIKITNLNESKSEYHFSYDTPAESKIPIRNEYNPLW